MVVFAHVFAGGSWDVSLDITTTTGRVSGRYGGDGVGDGISGIGWRGRTFRAGIVASQRFLRGNR